MIPLFTLDRIKTIVGTSIQLDPHWTQSAYDEIEIQYIKPFLCVALFNELKTQNDTNTLTPDNLILMNEYLLKAYARFFWSKAVYWNHYKITNKGVVINANDTSTPVTGGDMEKMRINFEQAGYAFLRETEEFLDENKSLYPLWKTDSCCKSGDSNGGSFYDGARLVNRRGASINW